jgi:hypothetical protein
VPFDPSAVHADPDGMRQAILQFEAILAADPSDIRARWLMNLAHMALGTWPDAIQPELVVPPSVFTSDRDVPAWRNLAPALGLIKPVPSGAAMMEDLDGDSWLDLILGSYDPVEPATVWHNNADGTFCDVTASAGMAWQPGMMGLTQADYDNDGDVDLYLARGAWQGREGAVRGSLLRNDGRGRFDDVTLASGLEAAPGPSQVGMWGDYDRDGWIDLFVAREALVQGTQESAPCSLYRNLGDGRFEDVAPALGLDALGVVKGAAWGDIDNDGDLDLYVSRFGQENLLFVSQAGRGFVERAAEFGVSEPIVSFPTFFFDYDQDGWLDLFVGSFDNELSLDVLGPDFGSSIGQVAADHMGLPSTASQSRLFRNTGGGFEDVSAAAGVLQADLVMGANFGDLNADGFPDIYLGTGAPTFDALQPNVAWLNDGAGRFLDVTSSAGLGHLQKGHGIAFGDLDEDGDEDLLAMIGGAVRGDAFGSALFENPSDASGSLTLRLVGTLSNRSAIGARVRVVTDARVIHAVVGSGGSFGSSSLQVEVGLGAATRVERVEIDWPSGLSEVVDGVSGGEVVEIVEGAGVRSARARAPVLLDGESDHDHGEIAP